MSSDPNLPSKRLRGRSSELTLRLISAAIGLPALGLILFFGFWTVTAATIVVVAAVGFETRDMAYGQSKRYLPRIVAAIVGTVIGATGMVAVAVGKSEDVNAIGTAFGILAAALLLEILITSRFRHVPRVRRNMVLAYGAIVAIAVSVLPLIASLDQGRELLAYVILVVFAADTGAYFVGKQFGTRQLAPDVSPGKTWEGLIGGIAAALLASWLLANLLSLEYSVARILFTGLAIAIVGATGDLAESWMKRLSGVKDSGALVPGHGGIMDRLDALAPNFMLIYFIDRWLG